MRNRAPRDSRPIVGSGPYRIARVDAGRSITYERDPNYWGRDLPVNRGRFNFDELRFDYFRERTAGLEALKSGVIDGMPYTLYADGSIEAQLPHGMVKFASVDALRAHLEKSV